MQNYQVGSLETQNIHYFPKNFRKTPSSDKCLYSTSHDQLAVKAILSSQGMPLESQFFAPR